MCLKRNAEDQDNNLAKQSYRDVVSNYPKIIQHIYHPIHYLTDEGIHDVINYLYEWCDKDETTKNINFSKLEPINGIIKIICKNKNKETLEWLNKTIMDINGKIDAKLAVVEGTD